MKNAFATTGVLALTAGSIMVVAPSAQAVDIQPGPASVTLAKCGDPSDPQSPDLVPNCSYSYLTPKSAPGYTYITAMGDVTFKDGSVAADGALNFPAAGQTWPKLSGLFASATSSVTPKDITGSVNAEGVVELTLNYDVYLENFAAKCTISGTTKLSSAATEKLGGGVGKNYDPATGAFAAASTTYDVPTLTPAPGSNCDAVTNLASDISKGMGWYLTGSLSIPGGQVVPPAQEQTATVKLPKSVKKKGKTVLLSKSVTTNAGQKATAKVTWSTKKSAKGTSKKYAKVSTTKSGKVTINTTGKAKKLYVKVSLLAPATDGYNAYSYSKTLRTK